MEPDVKRHKGLLISAWIVSIVALVLTAPVALFVCSFAIYDKSHNPESVERPFLYLAAPMIFLVLPIVAQIAYLCRCDRAAKGIAVAAIALCVPAFAFVAWFVLAIFQ